MQSIQKADTNTLPMEAVPRTVEVPRPELPDDLKGYGIEEGVTDFDKLDQDGKLPRYHEWIKQQPHIPGRENLDALRSLVREEAEVLWN